MATPRGDAGTTATSDLSARVLSVLADVLESDSVHSDLDLALYDNELLDSLRTVELIVALSDAFGIAISPAEIDRTVWATPRRVIDDVERRTGASLAAGNRPRGSRGPVRTSTAVTPR